MSLKLSAKISIFGEQTIAVKMFDKGAEFIGASILLKQQKQTASFVQVYLLLQGLEILCKGTLLLENYTKYKPLLKQNRKAENGFGHDLKKLIAEIRFIYNVKSSYADFDNELEVLPKNWTGLRYGEIIDILHIPETYETNTIYREIYKTMKFVINKHHKTFREVRETVI